MDISALLDHWSFDPLKVNARFVEGETGRLIQMRIDMGVLQMHYEGRPDGERPFGHTSFLEYYRALALGESDFRLTASQIFELRREGMQFYHRYLCLHELKDFAGVVRDTRHNLDILQFIARFGDPSDNFSSQQHRPYVLMMNTSAKVMQKLEEDDKPEALSILRNGIKQIRHIYTNLLEDPQPDLSPEIYQLKELQHRITDDGVPSQLKRDEHLEIELQMALLSENYERAAVLRDQIARTSPKT